MKNTLLFVLAGFAVVSSSFASDSFRVTYDQKIEGIKTYPTGTESVLEGKSVISASDEKDLKASEVILMQPRIEKDGVSARIYGNYMGGDSSAVGVCKNLGYANGRTFKNGYSKNSALVPEAGLDENGTLNWFDKNNIMFAEIIICSSN